MSTRIPDNKDSETEESNSNDYNEIDEKLSPYLIEDLKKPISENLLKLRDLHEILEKSQNLTKSQKLNFCNSERYLMKLYLKEIANRKKE